MGEDDGYRRRRRYFVGRAPLSGTPPPQVDAGHDAPYGRRDARFWWGVVAAVVVGAVIVGVGMALGL